MMLFQVNWFLVRLKIAERAKLAIEATVPIGGFDPEEYLGENALILAKISIASWSHLGHNGILTRSYF